MEIKTTHEISRAEQSDILNESGLLNKKWVAVDDLIELQDKIRKALISNSKCKCLLSTTRYADILDAMLWFELKRDIRNSETSRK